jgi:hypothetical protein
MNISLRAAAAAAMLVATALPTHAANRDFRFVNNSGQTLWELYVSPVSDSSWNSDILGRSVLESGRAMMVRFPGRGNECDYDLKMVMENGDSYTTQLDLCTISEYELTP